MMYDQYGNSGASGFGWLFMFLMMVLVILGVVAVIRYLSHVNGTTTKQNSAMEVLRNRYAKGEIDKKEFDDKRKDLQA